MRDKNPRTQSPSSIIILISLSLKQNSVRFSLKNKNSALMQNTKKLARLKGAKYIHGLNSLQPPCFCTKILKIIVPDNALVLCREWWIHIIANYSIILNSGDQLLLKVGVAEDIMYSMKLLRYINLSELGIIRPFSRLMSFWTFCLFVCLLFCSRRSGIIWDTRRFKIQCNSQPRIHNIPCTR